MYQMFAYSSFNDINLSSFDTGNVYNMSTMFAGCYSLSSLDLSHFNTGSVNDINSMFDNCHSLQSVNMSGWDTRNVNNMSYMFGYCYALQLVDLSHFITSNVTNMTNMFNYCNNLQSVNLSGWDTNNVTDMPYMFQSTHLRTIDLSHFRTSQLQNVYGMFAYCNYLEEVNMSNFDMTNVGSYDDMFGYCPGLHTLRLDNCNYDTISKIINSSNFPTGEATTAEGYPLNVQRYIYVQEANAAGLTAPDGWEFVYGESSEGGEPSEPSEPGEPVLPGDGEEEGGEDPGQTYTISFSTKGSKQLTVNNVDVTDQVVETGSYEDTISCKYETTEVIRQASFKDNTDLVRVFGLDTSMMFHTEEMFSGCTNLVAILPVLDSGMVYSTRAMFKNCTSLTSMETIGEFSAASNKSEMFYNCTSLTGTVPSWNYWLNGAVTEYENCFYNCTALDNYNDIPAEWGGPDDSEQ